MELLTKLQSLFKNKPVVVPPTPSDSDNEFLEFIAAQARNRTRDEQARKNNPPTPSAPLGNAA